GEWEIHRAADFTRRAGFTVIEDDHGEEFGTPPAPLRCDHAALYAGWYTLNHYNDAFSWNPGAIGIHLDSASAMSPTGGPNWSANALAHGITITAGATTEPYLDNLPHPDQAFLYLFQGANVGDALLRSERLLKWNILNIGDPLYRPFSHSPKLAAQVKPPIVFALLPQTALGDTTSGAAIGIDKPASQDLNFSVTTDHGDVVTTPPNVTIPAGGGLVKFPINTHYVSSDGLTVRLRVKAKGYEASNTLVLFSLFASLSVSSAKVKGGSPDTLTVSLRRPAFRDIAISLKSSNPAIAKVPEELTTSRGQDKAVLQVNTRPVSAETSVEISAAYEGLVRSATLKVVP
ncbi:MAG TPA: TIGR03790 family protein, partial [Bryobacteraceae bacterium]|nr:TIGR03790 family protein [Bryobacteraceae bacterium]